MIAKFIRDTARQAGKITLKYFKNAKVQYTKTHKLDIVTQADLASNKYIIESIKAKFPNDGIISEETGGHKSDAQSLWIIDPLDGTLNFSKGIPLYCVLIAHTENGVVDYGVIYDPVHDELLFAQHGKGAFLNGVKIICSTTDSLENSIGCVSNTGSEKCLKLLAKIRSNVGNKILYISSLLSIGINSAQAAAGRKDWFMSPGDGSVWDYAAGSVILSEAGCTVTDIKGKPWKIGDDSLSLLAANPVLHEKLLDVIRG